MATARIQVTTIKDKDTNLEVKVADLIKKDENGILKDLSGADIVASNSNKLAGRSINEVRDALTLQGKSLADIEGEFKPFDKIKLLHDSFNGHHIPSQFVMAVTEQETILVWGKTSHPKIHGANPDLDLSGIHEVYNPLKGISKVKQIACHYYSILVLYENGDLYAAGDNSYGQLGVGNTSWQYFLTKSSSNVDKLCPSGSGHHGNCTSFYYIGKDGHLYGAGFNASGQLGLGHTTQQTSWNDCNVPLEPGEKVIKASANTNYYQTVICLTDRGNVYGCGYNGYSQLGIGLRSTNEEKTFVRITGFENPVIDINIAGGWSSSSAAYYTSTFYLDNKGNVYAAGTNAYYQMANSNDVSQVTTITKIQVPIKPNTKIVKLFVTSAVGTVYAITDSKEMYGWGYNGNGELGLGNTENVSTPTFITNQVEDIFTASQSTGYVSSVFLTKTENDKKVLYSTGMNNQGQCGQGHITSPVNRFAPIISTFDVSQIKQITTCGYQSNNSILILLNDGRVYGAGRNSECQISPFHFSANGGNGYKLIFQRGI